MCNRAEGLLCLWEKKDEASRLQLLNHQSPVTHTKMLQVVITCANNIVWLVHNEYAARLKLLKGHCSPVQLSHIGELPLGN